MHSALTNFESRHAFRHTWLLMLCSEAESLGISAFLQLKRDENPQLSFFSFCCQDIKAHVITVDWREVVGPPKKKCCGTRVCSRCNSALVHSFVNHHGTIPLGINRTQRKIKDVTNSQKKNTSCLFSLRRFYFKF